MSDTVAADRDAITGPAERDADPNRSGIPRVPSDVGVAWLLSIGGLVGLLASATLLIEKIELLKDPDYVPSCSINPILSCGSIMRTSQAEVFGFPNPILGVFGFAVVLTLGVSLLSGIRYPRRIWFGLQAGATLGVVFVHWLIYQSLYRIGALCPYCMVVWCVTAAIFWYVTLHNLDGVAALRGGFGGRMVRVGAEFHVVVLTGWALVVAGLIAERFWDYWSTLLP